MTIGNLWSTITNIDFIRNFKCFLHLVVDRHPLIGIGAYLIDLAWFLLYLCLYVVSPPAWA